MLVVKTRTGKRLAATLIAVIVAALIIDSAGYALWCSRVERLAVEVAQSPSPWDGKSRAASEDPNAFAVAFSVAPTRVVTYGVKPVTGILFEPPWYVWSYSVFSRPALFHIQERFFKSSVAEALRLRPREPYNFSFSPTDGFRAHQGWRAVAQAAAN